MQILETLPRPFFVLAPMDDVTDTVFRQIIAECAAPDLYFTEFVNVDGLQSVGREKLLHKLRFTPKERPLIAQLWGKNPDNFYKTAKEIADGSLARELGLPDGVNFSGVDLNMGCPAKSEVQNGTCSALMLPGNRELAGKIIDASREGLNTSSTPLPLSVKTRLGFNEIDFTWHEFLLHKKLNMLTIHGRTKKQMSKVPAEWEQIARVREVRDQLSPAYAKASAGGPTSTSLLRTSEANKGSAGGPVTLIVGNGDVMNRKHGEELAAQYQLDGIMIGRGVFHDPFAFSSDDSWETYSKEKRIELYRKHVELFAKTWANNERKVITLNKFCKIYINGFDGAKEMREQLMMAGSTDELLKLL